MNRGFSTQWLEVTDGTDKVIKLAKKQGQDRVRHRHRVRPARPTRGQAGVVEDGALADLIGNRL